MADFRAVDVSILKWFPQSRKVVPATPIRVQTPPGPCTVQVLPGRYAVELTLTGHRLSHAFAEFVQSVEAHAQAHAKPGRSGLRWYSCLNADSLVPKLKLSAFDDTLFFDKDGTEVRGPPTDWSACACLVELTGAWTTDTAWGLRWKLLEAKRQEGVSSDVPCFIVDEDPGVRRISVVPAVPCMFLDDEPRPSHRHAGQFEGPAGDERGHHLAHDAQAPLGGDEPVHAGQSRGDEDKRDEDDGDDEQGLFVGAQDA